ncbi:MAG: site-specific integrase, partial [Chloroflexi bacterium]|nr:site-specific integrase [Chloroflexota bacterium]
ALFASMTTGGPLRYESLRDIVRRRAEQAGVEPPTLHSFRRAFALLSLRNGVDVYSLQRLMGHADLTVLRRYLAQTTEDVQNAHRQSGPVDHLL